MAWWPDASWLNRRPFERANSDQSNSPDGALGIVLLRCRRSYEQQKTSQGPVYFGHVSFSSDVKWVELKKRGHDTCLSRNLKAGRIAKVAEAAGIERDTRVGRT